MMADFCPMSHEVLVGNLNIVVGSVTRKTGFISWWVLSQRHNQAKEQEKEGFITCSK